LCGAVQMMMHEYKEHFSHPVTEMFPWIQDSYLAVVKKPMDFGTIDHKLNSGRYSYLSQVAADIHLVFDNAILYNKDAEDGVQSVQVLRLCGVCSRLIGVLVVGRSWTVKCA
jgi:hypothetical protein